MSTNASMPATATTMRSKLNPAAPSRAADELATKLLNSTKTGAPSAAKLTHVFGRRMAQRNGGHIFLVGSVAAYQPSPLAAAYGAAKAYVLSLGVALNVELAPSVGVTVLSPGLMDTEFHDVADYTMKPSMRRTVLPTDRVAAVGLDAMFAGRSSVIAGRLNRVMAVGSRLMSRSLQARIVYKISKT